MTRVDREILSVSELPKEARVTGHVDVNGQRRINVVMPDGQPRTYTLVAERRQGRWEVLCHVAGEEDRHVRFKATRADAIRDAGSMQDRNARLRAAGKETVVRRYSARQVTEVQS